MSLPSSARRPRGLDTLPAPRRFTPFLVVLAALDLGIWTYVGHAVSVPGVSATPGAAIALQPLQP